MAGVIRQAWELLTIGVPLSPEPPPIIIKDLIAGGETGAVEFKSTLRTNLHTGQVDEKIHISALKTIAAFLNAKGGTLLVGVGDNGEVLGLESDGFPNEDKMGLHLVNLVKDRIGELFLPYVHPHFEDQDGQRVLAIRCEKGPKAAFVKDGNLQRFFVRGGNATTELTGASVNDYCKQRFL
jgi:predicted HTH transcriptional regulator